MRVVVSESFAVREKITAGDSITLATERGPVSFDVKAVYYDYSDDRGVIVMDHATLARHFGAIRPTSLSVYLMSDADPVAVRDALIASLGPDRRVFVRTNGSLRRQVLRIFDRTFAITYALEAIAIFVAILGVAGTMLTLVLERRREFGMLRLVGASRSQLRRMVLIEAGFIGLVGQTVGTACGLLLSMVLIYVINVQSFGWSIQFHLPTAFLLQSSALVLLATALSGLWPARLATTLDPARQVAEADVKSGVPGHCRRWSLPSWPSLGACSRARPRRHRTARALPPTTGSVRSLAISFTFLAITPAIRHSRSSGGITPETSPPAMVGAMDIS